MIEGKIEVILEDTAENKHLIDESEHLSAANTRDFVKVVGTKKDAETMSMVGYVQFDNAVDVELWDGSPVYIVSHQGIPASIPANADERSSSAAPCGSLPVAAVGPANLPVAAVGPAMT